MNDYSILLGVFWIIFLIAGILVVLALFKIRSSEKFLPQWNELKDIEAALPARREQAEQLVKYIDEYRTSVAELEGEVGHLRILKEWNNANPEAPVKIGQMMADLEKGKSDLAAVQQSLAKDESKLSDSKLELEKLLKEHEITTREHEDLKNLHDELKETHETIKIEFTKTSSELENISEKLEEKREEYDEIVEQLEVAEEQKAEALREQREAENARDLAQEEKDLIDKAVESLKEIVNNINATLEKTDTQPEQVGIKICSPLCLMRLTCLLIEITFLMANCKHLVTQKNISRAKGLYLKTVLLMLSTQA